MRPQFSSVFIRVHPWLEKSQKLIFVTRDKCETISHFTQTIRE